MNFLKDFVLAIVGLVALNSMGYLAMETSMGYDIIVYGSIVVVELLVLNWFIKWIRPRAVTWDKEFDDEYDCDDVYDDECDCGDRMNDIDKSDFTAPDYNMLIKTYDEALDDLEKAARDCDDIAKENRDVTTWETETNKVDETVEAPAEETVEEPDNAGEVVPDKVATLGDFITK